MNIGIFKTLQIASNYSMRVIVTLKSVPTQGRGTVTLLTPKYVVLKDGRDEITIDLEEIATVQVVDSAGYVSQIKGEKA